MKSNTRAQIERAIKAAKNAKADRVRILPDGEIIIDLQPAPIDELKPDDFQFDHEDDSEAA